MPQVQFHVVSGELHAILEADDCASSGSLLWEIRLELRMEDRSLKLSNGYEFGDYWRDANCRANFIHIANEKQEDFSKGRYKGKVPSGAIGGFVHAERALQIFCSRSDLNEISKSLQSKIFPHILKIDFIDCSSIKYGVDGLEWDLSEGRYLPVERAQLVSSFRNSSDDGTRGSAARSIVPAYHDISSRVIKSRIGLYLTLSVLLAVLISLINLR
jgi:hypothetical protein